MNPTKIEWVKNPDGSKGFTWNPVTGCLHGCEYCYARKVALRFYTGWNPMRPFEPTFIERRLDQPAKRKKPARIFVVSMGDLFGEWVPDEWIKKVFAACEAAPQHTYYFLTKNPKRYTELIGTPMFDIACNRNMWFGASITACIDDLDWLLSPGFQTFVSNEPIKAVLDMTGYQVLNEGAHTDWLIVGSETRNGRPVNIPKREWLLDIRQQCKELSIPLFEKNSLAPLLPEGLIQQWPEEA